jgi:hypothetical protein
MFHQSVQVDFWNIVSDTWKVCLSWNDLTNFLCIKYPSCNFDCRKFCECLPSGLFYKNIMIVNDALRVISLWCHNLERYLRSSIKLLELSFMLLELSIMLLKNVYNTGITHDNCHLTIIICLKYMPLNSTARRIILNVFLSNHSRNVVFINYLVYEFFNLQNVAATKTSFN